METLLLSCIQAQILTGRIHQKEIPKEQKIELIREIKQVSPKECKIDAKGI